MTEGIAYSRAEIEKVLTGLAGEQLYRDNVFRITGLPTDASPRQIRRRREEAAIGPHMLTAIDPAGAPPPLPPVTDTDRLGAAFEALQNPILRFVHEQLWIGGHDAAHDAVIRRHCAAIENVGGNTSSIEISETLTDWWNLFAGDEIWSRARKRLAEIDDPRLSVSAIRFLEDRFPKFLLMAHAAIAAEAAADGDSAIAYRHLRGLQRSDAPAELVAEQLRAAVQPTERRIDTICTGALENLEADRGADTARDVLAETGDSLQVITILLGDEHFLTRGIKDQVAGAINGCAIAHFNKHRNGTEVLDELRAARELARSASLRELIDSNVRVVHEATRTAPPRVVPSPGYPPYQQPSFEDLDPDHLDTVLQAMIELGDDRTPERAYDRVQRLVRSYQDYQGRLYLSARLREPRLLAERKNEVRKVTRFNPFGISHLGWRDPRDPEDSEEKLSTVIVTACLFGGLLPLRAYIVPTLALGSGVRFAVARRVPLSSFARWWRAFLIATVVCGVLIWLGWSVPVALAVGYVGSIAAWLAKRSGTS